VTMWWRCVGAALELSLAISCDFVVSRSAITDTVAGAYAKHHPQLPYIGVTVMLWRTYTNAILPTARVCGRAWPRR
jgi:hypothetical protein